MVRVSFLLASVCACRPPGPEDDRPEESRHFQPPGTVELPATVPPVAGTVVEGDDTCGEMVLSSDVDFSSTVAIRTQEDFDFDVLGFLDTQRGYDIAGYTRTGDRHFVARTVGIDPGGIRSLATGDLVVAMPATGTLKLVTYETGESSTIVGGLVSPRSVEAGFDGMVYASEYYQRGTVRMIDPYTGENEVIVELPFPNGLALSNDDETLYIATSSNWYTGAGTIAAIDRDAVGNWIPEPRVVYQSDSLVDAMAVDECGNLYVAETYTGRVVRISAIDGQLDVLAELEPGPYGLSAARFGHGVGDFYRDELFISNRNQVFILQIGIDGRHVLAQ